MLKLDRAFARQGWRGCSGSLIIELERRLHELKCWEIRTSQMCAARITKHKIIGILRLFAVTGREGVSMQGKTAGLLTRLSNTML